MIIQPNFPPQMRENINAFFHSFSSLSLSILPYFILAYMQDLKPLTEFNAQNT